MTDAPFPWFGGKKMVADRVWAGLGSVSHYVEPFFGSGAVLLNAPYLPKVATINDFDGMVANFWRAVTFAPEEAAAHADWPVNEADLHARHLWLVNAKEALTLRLMADPDFYDAKVAGWWVWGISCSIGGGFCSGKGPWKNVNGVFSKAEGGQGVNRGLPRLSAAGQGVNRQLPHLGDAGRGVSRQGAKLRPWFAEIQGRLSTARVACGDWSRITGPSVLRAGGGVCGVFFDPPYSLEDRAAVYAEESDCAKYVLQWCRENGDNPQLRIVLAGYDGEHNELEALGWRVEAWKATGGFGNQSDGRGRENATRERLWFSPHCVSPDGLLL